jgi:acetyl esterase/lipase
MPDIPLAESVRPSDTSTSIVLASATTPQIEIGATPLKTYLDIDYAPGLKMDLLVPANGGPVPTVLYLPGGGFIFAQKDAGLPRRTYVAEAGFAVASIEYHVLSTAPTATYADAVADVHAAVRFLRANAETYGIDATNIGIWGESAGGYLASIAGVTADDSSSAVQAVVNQFGASDLARLADDFDPASQSRHAAPQNPMAAYLGHPGESLRDLPEAVANANPVNHISRTSPPHLLFHGTDDRMVSPSQTLLIHQALRDHGVESTRYVLEGAGHGDLAFLGDPDGGLPWSTTTVMDKIIDFLRRHLHPSIGLK